jgi:excisionase family DNA binding protein
MDINYKRNISCLHQIVEHLGIKQNIPYKKILKTRKSIPAHRIGRLWKFKISEIDKWVKLKWELYGS